jgi:predicted Zn-dependent protease
MLLEANRPAEALVAFEATMKKEPNRFRGLYGAGRAAEAAGQRDKARAFYAQLIAVVGDTQPSRPELQHARKF